MRRVVQQCIIKLCRRTNQAIASPEAIPNTNYTPGIVRNFARDSRGYEHFDGRAHWYGFPTAAQAANPGKWLLAATLAGGGAYYISSLEEVPYVHRRHAIVFITQASEKQLGKTFFEQHKAKAAMQHALLPEGHPHVRTVQRIGRKIAQVAADGFGGGQYGHMKGLEWEFAVIQSPMANAFVLPGGKVVVYSGLINLLESEDELAAVMAHEAERMSTLNLISIGRLLLYVALGISVPEMAAVLGLFLPFSRRAETEADVIGLRLMARACYDPGAATGMLSKLNAKEQEAEQRVGKVPGFLRTHPLTSARVARVKEELPAAYKLYYDADCSDRRDLLYRSLQHFPEIVVEIPVLVFED